MSSGLHVLYIPDRERGDSRLSLNLISILAAYEVGREDRKEDQNG
jgi:hypothetical protein